MFNISPYKTCLIEVRNMPIGNAEDAKRQLG